VKRHDRVGHASSRRPEASSGLLAIARVETDWGQARNGQPDELVPADVRAHVDVAALRPGGATATMLGLMDGRRIRRWWVHRGAGGAVTTGRSLR
jgi:hypothetical protein